MTPNYSGRLKIKLEWLLVAAGIIFCISQLAMSWEKPLLDQYSFRQTQTAISVYWILKGGAWLAYPTPVLGAPWSIPFEFPLYQWIVAIVAGAQHLMTLDQAGRLVSECFFLMCLWPLWRIASRYDRSGSLFRLCAVLLLFSPLYVFWSRSFMMESAVLFFSFWFVAALVDYLPHPSVAGFLEMTITAVIAAGIKITTFFGFSIAGAMIVVWSMYVSRMTTAGLSWLARYAAIAAAVAIAVVLLWTWVHYGDFLKRQNLLAKPLTSEMLTTWNFGTWGQRFSKKFLFVVFKRAPAEALGIWLVPAVAFVVVIFAGSKKQVAIFFALLFAFLSPILVFTNLHLIHHYYQYANSLFLVFAVAYALYLLSNRFPVVAGFLVVALVSLQLYGYSKYFYKDMMQPNRELQAMLATYAKAHTKPSDIVVGFGLTWSSEVPYYAQRRAMLISDGTAPDILTKLDSNLSRYTADHRVGAVIVCPNQLSVEDKIGNAYRAFLRALTVDRTRKTIGYCVVYS